MDNTKFLSTLSLRRATSRPRALKSRRIVFLSTLSLRRATLVTMLNRPDSQISIHALLAESDGRHRGDNRSPIHFYPRSPCGERLSSMLYDTTSLIFLSTLSLRRATQKKLEKNLGFEISIHALLAESDPLLVLLQFLRWLFLSTLSLRRATFSVFASPFSIFYFYPRSPCGERLEVEKLVPLPSLISIHALLAESDHGLYSLVAITPSFLSTLSLRRATKYLVILGRVEVISIHALLAESDLFLIISRP